MLTVAAIALSTALLFVYAYVDLQYYVQKMVLETLHFPIILMRRVRDKVH